MNYKYRHTETYKGHRIDKRANSMTELSRKVEEAKRKIDRGPTEDTTLRQWASFWLETYKAPAVSNSWLIEIERRTRPLIDALGHKKLPDIKTSDLQRYINNYAGKSEKYIRTNLNIAKDVFRAAYLDRRISEDPGAFLTMPAGEKTKTRRSLTREEQEAFLETVPPEIERETKIMFYCGLRPGEALSLTWDDISLERGIIAVRRALKKDGTTGLPKTSASNRDVPIPDVFIPELARWQGRGAISKIPTAKSLGRKWRAYRKAIAERTGTPEAELQLYMLRHTYCTNLEKAGVPINIAKALMGHATIEMTARIYTHFDDDTLELARRLINAG